MLHIMPERTGDTIVSHFRLEFSPYNSAQNSFFTAFCHHFHACFTPRLASLQSENAVTTSSRRAMLFHSHRTPQTLSHRFPE